jgi:hypothetical protein
MGARDQSLPYEAQNPSGRSYRLGEGAMPGVLAVMLTVCCVSAGTGSVSAGPVGAGPLGAMPSPVEAMGSG